MPTKNRIIFLTLVIITMTSPCFAQNNSDTNDYIYPFRTNDGAWIFCNENGNSSGNERYDQIFEFGESFALVSKNKRWGVISKEGRVIIPWEFDTIRMGFYHSTNIKVGIKTDDKSKFLYGIYSLTGEKITECIYLEIDEYRPELDYNRLITLLSNDAFDVIYVGIKTSNGLNRDYIFPSEKFIISSEELDKLSATNRYVLISPFGIIWNSEHPFHRIRLDHGQNTNLLVNSKNLSALITIQGDTLISSKDYFFIDERRNEIFEKDAFYVRNDKFGVIDFSGNIIVPLVFDQEPLIKNNHPYLVYGMVDSIFRIYRSPTDFTSFENIQHIGFFDLFKKKEILVAFVKDGKKGCLTTKKELFIPPKYEKIIQNFGDNESFFVCSTKRRVNIYSENGELIRTLRGRYERLYDISQWILIRRRKSRIFDLTEMSFVGKGLKLHESSPTISNTAFINGAFSFEVRPTTRHFSPARHFCIIDRKNILHVFSIENHKQIAKKSIPKMLQSIEPIIIEDELVAYEYEYFENRKSSNYYLYKVHLTKSGRDIDSSFNVSYSFDKNRIRAVSSHYYCHYDYEGKLLKRVDYIEIKGIPFIDFDTMFIVKTKEGENMYDANLNKVYPQNFDSLKYVLHQQYYIGFMKGEKHLLIPEQRIDFGVFDEIESLTFWDRKYFILTKNGKKNIYNSSLEMLYEDLDAIDKHYNYFTIQKEGKTLWFTKDEKQYR